jgi:anti-sigma-K factor RskA
MNKLSDSIYELLAGYVSGDLDPDELEQCRQLLIDQPELETEIAAIESSLSLVINTFSAADPSPMVRQNLLQAVAQEQSHAVISMADWRQGSRWNWQRLANGVAAALVLGLGWHSFQLQQQLASNQTLLAAFQSPEARLFAFEGMMDPSSTGRLMFDPQMQQASLAFYNLPAAAENQVFRLWAMVGSNLVPCGEAIPANQPSMVVNFDINPEEFPELFDPNLRGFKVTLEDSPNVPAPLGSVVLEAV